MDFMARESLQRAHRLLGHALHESPGEDEAKRSAGFLDMPRRDLERYSILRAARQKLASIMAGAGGLGSTTFSGVEAECHLELVERFGEPEHQGTILVPADVLYRRDLQAATAGAGGYLVSTKNVSFIDRLRNLSVADRLGVRHMPGQTGNVTLPKGSGGSSTTWLSNEGSQAAESTPTYVQLSSTPKTCSAYTEVSGQMVTQGGPEAEAIFLDGLAAEVAIGEDAAVISGSGAAGQPTGILNTVGIGTASGTSLGYSGLVAAQKTVADGNAILNPAALGYVTTPTEAERLKSRARFTNTDTPVWSGSLHDGTVEGVRALASKQIPSATLVYGDWSSVIIPEWGVLSVQVNPFTDFKSGIVGLRCLWSLDVIVQHPGSFVAITSIT